MMVCRRIIRSVVTPSLCPCQVPIATGKTGSRGDRPLACQCQRPCKKKHGCCSKCASDIVQLSPPNQHRPAPSARLPLRHRHQAFVDRHDDEQRERPVSEQQDASSKPSPVGREIPGDQSRHAPSHRHPGLNWERSLVAGLPLREQRSVCQPETRRMFDQAYVEGGADEQGG
jgi:hypothetical protein